MAEKIVAIADFSIIPIGTGKTSMGEYIAAAVRAIEKDKRIRYEVTSMGTIMEGERLEDLLAAVGRAHEAVFAKGIKRIESVVKIDDRRDKPRTKELKVSRIKAEITKI
ncbi:MAG: MTH1187 family thiamine-binding protein [Candidatus Hydrothermarchaeota archaeon]